MTETVDTKPGAKVAPLTRRGAILAALTLSGALAVTMPAEARPAPVEATASEPNPFEARHFETLTLSETESDLIAAIRRPSVELLLPFSSAAERADSDPATVKRERRQYQAALRRQRAALARYLAQVDALLLETA